MWSRLSIAILTGFLTDGIDVVLVVCRYVLGVWKTETNIV